MIDIDTNMGARCPCPEVGNGKWQVSMGEQSIVVSNNSSSIGAARPLLNRSTFEIYAGPGFIVALDSNGYFGNWRLIIRHSSELQSKAVRLACLRCDFREREMWARRNMPHRNAAFLSLNNDRLIELIDDVGVCWDWLNYDYVSLRLREAR